MKTFKLLTLTAIGVGLLSGLSFAQDFPVTVTATVTAPASEYTLEVDGAQADSIKFDLGSVEVGKTVNKNVQFAVNQGNQDVTKNINATLKNDTITNNLGTAHFGILNTSTMSGAINLSVALETKASGVFNGTTALQIMPK